MPSESASAWSAAAARRFHAALARFGPARKGFGLAHARDEIGLDAEPPRYFQKPNAGLPIISTKSSANPWISRGIQAPTGACSGASWSATIGYCRTLAPCSAKRRKLRFFGCLQNQDKIAVR